MSYGGIDRGIPDRTPEQLAALENIQIGYAVANDGLVFRCRECGKFGFPLTHKANCYTARVLNDPVEA